MCVTVHVHVYMCVAIITKEKETINLKGLDIGGVGQEKGNGKSVVIIF